MQAVVSSLPLSLKLPQISWTDSWEGKVGVDENKDRGTCTGLSPTPVLTPWVTGRAGTSDLGVYTLAQDLEKVMEDVVGAEGAANPAASYANTVS